MPCSAAEMGVHYQHIAFNECLQDKKVSQRMLNV